MTDEIDEFGFPSHEYGTDQSGKWNEATKSYFQNPSAENYVRLRRENPDQEIATHIHGGIDQLFAVQDELRKYQIDPDKFVSVFDGDEKTISFYSLFFLEELIKARKLAKEGETHLVRRGIVVPDKLIDWFITCSLDAITRYNPSALSRDLVVLIRERFGGPNPEYEKRAEVKKLRLDACWIAGSLLARGKTPTFRIVGEVLGVAPSTVKRWFADGEFEAEAQFWSRTFDENGAFRGMNKPPALREKQRAQRSPIK